MLWSQRRRTSRSSRRAKARGLPQSLCDKNHEQSNDRTLGLSWHRRDYRVPDWCRLLEPNWGTACLAPELEGAFLPLRNDCSSKDRKFLSPEHELAEHFVGPKWRGTGAISGIDEADADVIDAIVKKYELNNFLKVDRTRLSDSHEAWVYVEILGSEGDTQTSLCSGFEPYPRPGVLTWCNSD